MKLTNVWNYINKVRDNIAFSLDKGATYGPSKPVQDELAKGGWTFRREVVVTPGGPGFAESLHPVLNGVEISATKGGRYTPEWERYETERLAAVYKVHNRKLPDVLPVPKAGELTSLAEIWRKVQHWSAKNEVLGPHPEVMAELRSHGWTFRSETVIPTTPMAMPVEINHPITPEGHEIERGSLHWTRYEQARMAAVEKLFGKPAPTPAAPSCGCS